VLGDVASEIVENLR